MDPRNFRPGAPGKLVTLQDGTLAFVPDPLPPRLDLGGPIVGRLAEASRRIGNLEGTVRNLPNPEILIQPLLRREAILSSRIEGTVASEQELVLFDVSPPGLPEKPAIREVANHVKALRLGSERLKELPLCLRLLRDVHAELMRDVRGGDRSPGEFRSVQNYIAEPNQPIAEARFVPPPPADMRVALDRLEKFMNSPHGIDPLLEAALIHYQFEAIHPFSDGNGRIGRVLVSLLLTAREVLTMPVLNLSAYFDRHRQEYVDHLLRVSQQGTWTDWLRFFLDGVSSASVDAVARSQKLLNLRREYRRRLQRDKGPARVLEVLDLLFASPAVSATLIAQRLGVHFISAQNYIKKLEKLGILREVTGRKRNRVYLAVEILAVTGGASP